MRNWHFRYRAGWVVVFTLIFALVIGCDGGGDSTSTSQSDDDGTSDDNGTDDDGTEGDGTEGDGDSSNESADEELAWVPFGPDDPVSPIPGPWPVYNAFAQQDCAELRDSLNDLDDQGGDVGQAMLAVCLAAVEGVQDQWQVAARLKDGDGSFFGADVCLYAVVKDLLDRAVAWHDSNPGLTPEVRIQSVASETECGREARARESQENGGDPGTEDPGGEEEGTEDPGGEEEGTEDPGGEDEDTDEPGTEGWTTEEPEEDTG